MRLLYCFYITVLAYTSVVNASESEPEPLVDLLKKAKDYDGWCKEMLDLDYTKYQFESKVQKAISSGKLNLDTDKSAIDAARYLIDLNDAALAINAQVLGGGTSMATEVMETMRDFLSRKNQAYGSQELQAYVETRLAGLLELAQKGYMNKENCNEAAIEQPLQTPSEKGIGGKTYKAEELPELLWGENLESAIYRSIPCLLGDPVTPSFTIDMQFRPSEFVLNHCSAYEKTKIIQRSSLSSHRSEHQNLAKAYIAIYNDKWDDFVEALSEYAFFKDRISISLAELLTTIMPMVKSKVPQKHNESLEKIEELAIESLESQKKLYIESERLENIDEFMTQAGESAKKYEDDSYDYANFSSKYFINRFYDCVQNNKEDHCHVFICAAATIDSPLQESARRHCFELISHLKGQHPRNSIGGHEGRYLLEAYAINNRSFKEDTEALREILSSMN